MRAHKVVQDREAYLLAELKRLVDDYTIQKISNSKALLSAVKGNQNREISIGLLDGSMKRL